MFVLEKGCKLGPLQSCGPTVAVRESVIRVFLGPIFGPRYEMLLIRELTPSLNVQSDSMQGKLFV